MKKFLIIALVAAMAVTGGVYAYTYTTATATINATAMDSDFAKVEVADSLPDFGDVLGHERRDLADVAGTLFVITPHDDYTGDLLVKVYLQNAGALSKAYQQLNLQLYLENSVESEEEEHEVQLLTLDNGQVTFNLEGQAGNACDLDLVGGTYITNPWSPLEWEEGYSVTPQLYAEVTQR